MEEPKRTLETLREELAAESDKLSSKDSEEEFAKPLSIKKDKVRGRASLGNMPLRRSERKSAPPMLKM